MSGISNIIDKIKEKKYQLEAKLLASIHPQLQKFKDETGLSVQGIEAVFYELTDVDDDLPRYNLTDIIIKVGAI